MNTMRKITFLFFFAALIFLTIDVKAQASPEKGQKAIGLMVGDPTGISFKSWTGSKNAFDLGVAWSLSNTDAISVHGDYLWHAWIDDVEKGKLALYYGIGARVLITDNDSNVGARIPLGINYLLEDAPIDFFIEIAPIINVLPDTDADGDGAIGIRFYF